MIPKSFSLADTDEFQIELTGYCNAACPQCPRNINGGKENPYFLKEHLPRDVIDKAFTKEVCMNLRQVFFCGNYGDPIMHPDLLGIISDFRNKNPDIWITMHTNGGAHTPDWWRNLATEIGEGGQVSFNIDGLEDTNHLYRCNTDFNKIITNAEAFIRAGGSAEWNFIVFEHNQHQVEGARMLASIMGFKSFNERATGRFLNQENFTEIEQWPKENRDGVVEYYIKPPTIAKYKNNSMMFLPKLKEQHKGDLTEYFSTTPITCDSLVRHHGNNNSCTTKSKLLITSNGLVMPCNFFNHNLNDPRFNNRKLIPGASDLAFLPSGLTQIEDLFDRHGYSNLNIYSRTLEQVMQSPFWTEVAESFNKKLGEGRFFECALTCGKDFYKVWDQLEPQGMKYLITGGNRGLGLELVKHFRGRSISRTDDDFQADITNPHDVDRIVIESLNYDVFINNAFDGPAGADHANFAQTELLIKVFDAWKAANKKGYIINIGSSSIKDIVPPEPTFERYRVSKAALEHASKQCTKAFKDNIVPFKTTLINFDRLDTPLSRSRDNWTGNGTACSDVISMIEMLTNISNNTCIEEITSWLNRDFSEDVDWNNRSERKYGD